LLVPKAQFLNAIRRQNFFAFLITLVLFRQAMLKSVQFNGQSCGRTIEIEKIISHRLLPAEFEFRKTPGPQGTP